MSAKAFAKQYKEKPEFCGVQYPYITVTSGMSGYFAVLVWLNTEEPDLGPFPEPYDTGEGRYETAAEAAEEGRIWAQMMELPFRETEATTGE